MKCGNNYYEDLLLTIKTPRKVNDSYDISPEIFTVLNIEKIDLFKLVKNKYNFLDDLTYNDYFIDIIENTCIWDSKYADNYNDNYKKKLTILFKNCYYYDFESNEFKYLLLY
jgi:hypothetical protein